MYRLLIGGGGTYLFFIYMKDYRKLTEDEVLQLKSQSCLADDWGNVSWLRALTVSTSIILVSRVK